MHSFNFWLEIQSQYGLLNEAVILLFHPYKQSEKNKLSSSCCGLKEIYYAGNQISKRHNKELELVSRDAYELLKLCHVTNKLFSVFGSI